MVTGVSGCSFRMFHICSVVPPAVGWWSELGKVDFGMLLNTCQWINLSFVRLTFRFCCCLQILAWQIPHITQYGFVWSMFAENLQSWAEYRTFNRHGHLRVLILIRCLIYVLFVTCVFKTPSLEGRNLYRRSVTLMGQVIVTSLCKRKAGSVRFGRSILCW